MRFLRRLALSYLDLDGNRNFVSSMNGETRVLDIVAGSGARVLFDVGANVGEWTRDAHGRFDGAEIHAFEVVPDIAAELRRQVGSLPGVTVNEVGLDAETGEIEVRYYPSFSEGSGFGAHTHDLPYETRRATVTTGDLYCRQHGIEHIDLLKVDVEGVEHRVLRGFDGMLRRGAIDVVQFEYGPFNIESHMLLRDYHEMFAELGYRVGRIFPSYVDFHPYRTPVDEDFRGPNFVAVRDGALIAQLSGQAPARTRS
jgi:FkbM family methyltransferase